METLQFYEKPGCITNSKQKQLLKSAGIAFKTNDLLNHPWTQQELEGFFQGLPVKDWLNKNSPKVKSGEVDPKEVTASQAITLMMKDPLLIRRPLIELDSEKWCGFDMDLILLKMGMEAGDYIQVSEDCSNPTSGNCDP